MVVLGRRLPIRWIVLTLLSVACFMNYIDRQMLSLLAKPLQADLGMTDVDYANVVTAFLIAYTFGNIVAAWIVERFGARRGLAFFVGIWSISCALSGAAQNVIQLGATRLVLGLGEVGNWTAASVLVRQWFTPVTRGLAIGLYSSTAMLGATLAPPLISVLGLTFGWRATFVIAGAIGIVWVVIWLVAYRRSSAELVEQKAPQQSTEPDIAVRDPGVPQKEMVPTTWSQVVRQPRLWALIVCGMFANPVWYFYLFWFPKYLTDERGMTLAQLGQSAWIVYLSAGVGSLVGGALSGMLVKRGMNSIKARLVVMTIAALIAPIGLLNAFAPAIEVSLLAAAAVAFCNFLWTVNATALLIEMFPAADIPKVLGVKGIFSGLASVGTNYLVAALVGSISYKPMFAIMALVFPIALVAAWTSAWLSRRQLRLSA